MSALTAIDFILIERALAGFDKAVDVAGPVPSTGVALDVIEFTGQLTSAAGDHVNVRVTLFADCLDALVYDADFEEELTEFRVTAGYAAAINQLVADFTK